MHYANYCNYGEASKPRFTRVSQKLSPNRQTAAIRGTHRSISVGFREFARRTVKTRLGIGTIVIKRWNGGAETEARSSSPNPSKRDYPAFICASTCEYAHGVHAELSPQLN